MDLNITFESMAETTIPITIIPQFNREKLLIHNLQVPMERRIHGEDLRETLNYAHMRGNLAALQVTIDNEVAPIIAAEWQKWESL